MTTGSEARETMSRVLVDTNVLVYAHDRSEPTKQRRARHVIERLLDRPETYLTAQVLAETFRALTQRLSAPLSLEEAEDQIMAMRDAWTVLPVTDVVVIEAIRGVREHQLAFWYAQIWATARLHRITTVLSEDLPSPAAVETVSFADPLNEEYDLDQLS